MIKAIAVPMVLQAPPTEPPASVSFKAGAANATTMPAPSATAPTTALLRHPRIHELHDLRMMDSPVQFPTRTTAPAFDNPTTGIIVCTHTKIVPALPIVARAGGTAHD